MAARNMRDEVFQLLAVYYSAIQMCSSSQCGRCGWHAQEQSKKMMGYRSLFLSSHLAAPRATSLSRTVFFSILWQRLPTRTWMGCTAFCFGGAGAERCVFCHLPHDRIVVEVRLVPYRAGGA
jgi:hypothetical protein